MMLEDQNLAIMFNKINHFADASLQLNATVNTNHYITFISTDLDISHKQLTCMFSFCVKQGQIVVSTIREQRAGTNHGVTRIVVTGCYFYIPSVSGPNAGITGVSAQWARAWKFLAVFKLHK